MEGRQAKGPVTAYLGLGSNLGRRQDNLTQALSRLAKTAQVGRLASSSIYETEPWGYAGQPPFLNSAAKIETTLTPTALLELAKEIEAKLGRQPSFRFGPRSIDVDILLYSDWIIDWETPDLQIPHSRLSERAFVLIPLAELAGEAIHPRLKTPIGQLAHQVSGAEGVKLWSRSPF